jgi:hypothetical protein
VKLEAVRRVMDSPNLSCVSVTLVARLLLWPVAQNMCSFSDVSFKSFAVVREACKNAYPDRDVTNKTMLMSPASLYLLL